MHSLSVNSPCGTGLSGLSALQDRFTDCLQDSVFALIPSLVILHVSGF